MKKKILEKIELIYEVLARENATISTAESCTGGMIGEFLTEIAGSSTFYNGGIISYSNEAKHKLLNVSKDILEHLGSVSAEAAKEMAEGCRKQFASTYSLAVTGIAGPGGATDTKPVGLVYMAISYAQDTFVYKHNFMGDRNMVRLQTVDAVLQHLLDVLNNK